MGVTRDNQPVAPPQIDWACLGEHEAIWPVSRSVNGWRRVSPEGVRMQLLQHARDVYVVARLMHGVKGVEQMCENGAEDSRAGVIWCYGALVPCAKTTADVLI